MMISMILMIMIRWAVRLLACHPLVQERLQAELDQVDQDDDDDDHDNDMMMIL